jgi:hypothetical protein
MIYGPYKVWAAKSALFWDITQLIIRTGLSGQTVGPILKDKIFFLDFLKLEDGTDRCLETSRGNYHSTLRDVPQKHIPHLLVHRGGRLKSRFGHETCDMPQHIHHLH